MIFKGSPKTVLRHERLLDLPQQIEEGSLFSLYPKWLGSGYGTATAWVQHNNIISTDHCFVCVRNNDGQSMGEADGLDGPVNSGKLEKLEIVVMPEKPIEEFPRVTIISILAEPKGSYAPSDVYFAEVFRTSGIVDYTHMDEGDTYRCVSECSYSSGGCFWRNLVPVVRRLLVAGADPNARDGESGWSSLHRVLHFGHLAVAGVLIKAGASLTLEDSRARTPVDLLSGPVQWWMKCTVKKGSRRWRLAVRRHFVMIGVVVSVTRRMENNERYSKRDNYWKKKRGLEKKAMELNVKAPFRVSGHLGGGGERWIHVLVFFCPMCGNYSMPAFFLGKDNFPVEEVQQLEDNSVGMWTKPSIQRKTKIVCTIGPSTSTPEMIRKLAEEGMNVARMNMSHGDHASHKKVIDLVKEYNAQSADNVIAIMLDTKGPEVRSGDLPRPIMLSKGQEFTFTIKRGVGSENCVSVNYDDFVNDVEKGDTLLVDAGQTIRSCFYYRYAFTLLLPDSCSTVLLSILPALSSGVAFGQGRYGSLKVEWFLWLTDRQWTHDSTRRGGSGSVGKLEVGLAQVNLVTKKEMVQPYVGQSGFIFTIIILNSSSSTSKGSLICYLADDITYTILI
eukprot:Gb_25408 [translate_table: standard]